MHRIAFAIAAILGIFIALPAWAQSEIVITQAKALAGNITPGDTAGYPITLSQPGAYILGSNLAVPLNQIGIYANSNNIDIDFNGFRLNGGNAAYHGVVSAYGESRIHGGVISQFKLMGIYIRGNAWTIEDMQITRNGNTGIDATGARFIRLQDSLVALNGSYGIYTGDDGVFRDNTVSDNQNVGIVCATSCHIEGNLIDKNAFGVSALTGMAIGNTITRSISNAIYDSTNPGSLGLANNMFVDNAPQFDHQLFGGVAVHPNTCAGKPC